MPRLMEKKDWMQTVANVDAAESIWYENITSDEDSVPLPLPGRGSYQVILLKIAEQQTPKTSPRCKSARELIGYGRKFDPREEHFGCPRPDYSKLIGYGERFHTPRSTAEWMKELREGEEE